MTGRLGYLVVAALLAACGPTEEKKAKWAENKRIECLDKICEGDKPPPRDPMREEVMKFNGQWFIGPKDYFSTGMNGAAFFWPSKTPARPNVPDFPEKALATSGHSEDVTIEIFLRAHDGVAHGPSAYKSLLKSKAEGEVISTTAVRDGLDAWHVKEGSSRTATWYVATNLKDKNGEPPVLFCRGEDPKFARCSMGFIWRPGIAADFRFRAKHAQDWPEIYQEIVRVLDLLKEVKA